MKVTIFYNGDYSDSLSFECNDIKDARTIALSECSKRGWDQNDCHSEVEH